MKLTNTTDAIAWMVKNHISCSGYTVDAIVAANIDTDDPNAVKRAQEIEEHIFSVTETTPQILFKLREALGLSFDDTSRDSKIRSYSLEEALDVLLRYEGIIGYTSTILGWIDDFSQFREQQKTDFFGKSKE